MRLIEADGGRSVPASGGRAYPRISLISSFPICSGDVTDIMY
jgi:hypothetical protein